MLVGDVMDRDLTSLAEGTTLLEAISLMAMHDTSGLPVLNTAGYVVGFLSEKDVLNAVIPGYLGYMDENFRMPDAEKITAMLKRVGHDPAQDYMAKDCVAFDEFETVSNAIMIFFRKNIRRAPVTKDGMLIGMADRKKVIQRFIQHNFEDNAAKIPVLDES